MGIFGIDSLSPHDRQLSVRLYVFAAEQYQQFGRPILRDHIACRFQPTCSVYSIESVQKFGLMRGLLLTFDRLSRCRDGVPLGTIDKVPEVEID